MTRTGKARHANADGDREIGVSNERWMKCEDLNGITRFCVERKEAGTEAVGENGRGGLVFKR